MRNHFIKWAKKWTKINIVDEIIFKIFPIVLVLINI